MDLAIAMVPFIDSKGLIMLYKAIEPLLVVSQFLIKTKRSSRLLVCSDEQPVVAEENV